MTDAIEIWPGRPYPLGATYDGGGHQLLAVLRGRRGGRAVPVRRRRRRAAGRPGRGRRLLLARLPARRWRPGQRYGYRVHGPWDPDERPALQPGQAAARPVRQGHRGRGRLGRRPCFPYNFGDENSRNDDDSAAVRAQVRRAQPVLRLGQRPARRTSRSTSRSSTRCTSRASPPRHPGHPRGAARHLRAGWPTRPPSSTCTGLGVTAVELLPVHQFVHDAPPGRAGAAQLLGLQLDRLPRPAQRLRRRRPAGRAGRTSSRPMVRALHAAGIEVILDVVYNHTAEGNHLGPMLSLKGIDNAAYYRLVADDPQFYYDTTGTGNSLNVRPPAHAAADHGLAALLGDRDARRRVPLRPGRHPGPPVPRGRPAVGVLRPHPAGPGRQPGQADRRAVGHRRGRLPGRQLPAAVVGVERPYRDTVRDFWRGEPATPRRVRLPAHRQLRPLPGRRPAPGRQRQLRHRPRRLHAARPGLLQRQAQRGQRRGQQRRREPTTARGTAASRATPTTRTSSRCGTASSATSSPPCCCPRASPMLLGGDEIGRTQHGNNNAYCQDNEISWFDWDQRRRGPAGLHPPADRAAPRASGAAPAPLVPGPAHPRLGGPRLVQAGRRRDERRRLGRGLRQLGRPVPQRRGDHRPGPARPAGHRRLASCCCSTPTTSRSTGRCPSSGASGGS